MKLRCEIKCLLARFLFSIVCIFAEHIYVLTLQQRIKRSLLIYISDATLLTDPRSKSYMRAFTINNTLKDSYIYVHWKYFTSTSIRSKKYWSETKNFLKFIISCLSRGYTHILIINSNNYKCINLFICNYIYFTAWVIEPTYALNHVKLD